MQRDTPNIDGFVVRRRSPGSTTRRPRATLDTDRAHLPDRFMTPAPHTHKEAQHMPLVQRGDIATKLGAHNNELPPVSPKDTPFNLDLDDAPVSKKDKKRRRPKLPRKKLIIRIAIVLLVIILAVAGYFGYKFFTASGKVFKGNIVTAIFSKPKELKMDENGQTNVLLFGTSEDDPDHDGEDLTDSIMVVSINQKQNYGFMVSIPRDLHVKYNKACVSGYQGKINVVYSCSKPSGEDAGAEAIRKSVGEVVGLDIQYSAHLNYTVLRQAVDAVGGITVNIESSDPRGILDRNFDWDCPKGGQTCFNVKYPNGPAQLDGKHALYLARARGDDPLGRTYGLTRSNPDRQDNQRKILLALKDKASSAGVLANPVAVNNLLEAVGNNLRTNFDAEEIKTLIELAKNIKTEDLSSISLEDKDKPLTTVSCFSGNICPNAGPFNYSAIHALLQIYAKNDKFALEGAKVEVLNSSGTVGQGQAKADELSGKGVNVINVANGPAALGAQPISLYDMSNGKKPGTLKKLQELLGVTAVAGAPEGVTSKADFVVVVGAKPAE